VRPRGAWRVDRPKVVGGTPVGLRPPSVPPTTFGKEWGILIVAKGER